MPAPIGLLLWRPEDVALVMCYLVFFEEREVFLAKSLPRMVLHLVTDVINHAGQLRVGVRKGPETLLPREPARHPVVLVDVISRAGFYISDQIRKGHVRLEANEDVRLVWHTMDRD